MRWFLICQRNTATDFNFPLCLSAQQHLNTSRQLGDLTRLARDDIRKLVADTRQMRDLFFHFFDLVSHAP